MKKLIIILIAILGIGTGVYLTDQRTTEKLETQIVKKEIPVVYECDDEFNNIEGVENNNYDGIRGNCELIKVILKRQEKWRVEEENALVEQKYCESLGNLKQSELPVKCLRYWQ